MRTVILCGGQGTRLREETEHRPKPMVPVGDRPILCHIMQRYARFGHRDFVLCLGYKGEQIREYFERGPGRALAQDWRVALCDTGLEAMTAWRLREVRSQVGAGTFFLTYGDGVGSVDLAALLAFHRQARSVCTLTAVHPPGRFGEVRLGPDGLVENFHEKPQREAGYVNGGFMACEPAIFDYLPDNPAVMLEQEPLQRLVADRKLAAYRHEGFWQPMDTYHEFTLLNRLYAGGHAPWME